MDLKEIKNNINILSRACDRSWKEMDGGLASVLQCVLILSSVFSPLGGLILLSEWFITGTQISKKSLPLMIFYLTYAVFSVLFFFQCDWSLDLLMMDNPLVRMDMKNPIKTGPGALIQPIFLAFLFVLYWLSMGFISLVKSIHKNYLKEKEAQQLKKDDQ